MANGKWQMENGKCVSDKCKASKRDDALSLFYTDARCMLLLSLLGKGTEAVKSCVGGNLEVPARTFDLSP